MILLVSELKLSSVGGGGGTSELAATRMEIVSLLSHDSIFFILLIQLNYKVVAVLV